MRQGSMIAGLLVVSLAAVGQQNSPEPKISSTPLTSEQIAVYRSVLTAYMKGSDRLLNLANITEPPDQTDASCLKGLDVEVGTSLAQVVHRIDPALIADTKIALVDTQRQQKAIKENDPGNLMRKAIEDHQEITDDQLDKSLKSAFDSALFTLSEIIFEKEHHRAVVSYSFACGRLCGNGQTLLLKKIGNKWTVAKRCGGWVA